MTFGNSLSRRAFALAGALVAARGGLVRPQVGQAQGSTPGPYTTPQPPPDPVAIPSVFEVQDSYTFVVAGLDTRGVDDDQNTDVIMLSRVEVANRRVRTISIPRDLLAEIPGYGWFKINGAHNIGSKDSNYDWNAGVALLRSTIEWSFNFRVDGIVTTNLHKMHGVIDAMGGITLINPYDVYDDRYPTPDFGVKEIFYPAGELRLNGEQAMEFSRTRHMGFDEGRVMGQHFVLGACLAELRKPGKPVAGGVGHHSGAPLGRNAGRWRLELHDGLDGAARACTRMAGYWLPGSQPLVSGGNHGWRFAQIESGNSSVIFAHTRLAVAGWLPSRKYSAIPRQ